jgi:hypothetical protein
MDYVFSLQCGWAAIHLIGLAAALLVRIYANTAAEGALQCLFLCGLASVAVATLAGEQFAWSLWTLSAATLSTMIIVAIADCSSSPYKSA